MNWLLAFAAIVSPSGPDQLTLDDALAIALKNAFSLRIAGTRLEKAQRQEKQAKGAFGPTVTAQGSYSRFDGGGSSGGSTGGGGGSSATDSKSASLALTQIVDISGLSRRALQATTFTKRAAEAGLGVEANNLKLAVRTAFFAVLLDGELVQVQADALKAAQLRYEKALVKEKEGALSKFDVLRFENEVRKTEQALTLARGTYVASKHTLNNTLSRPIEAEFEPVPIDALPTVPEDVAGLVVEAIKNRPEIKQSEFTIESLERLADVQGASFKPSLVIQATHTRFLNPGASQSDKSTVGSVVLSFPLFDSGIAESRVDAAKRDTDQARIALEQLLLGIALEVRNAHTAAVTAKSAYEVSLDSVRLATEALRLADLRYNEGAGILLDVTQAQADLTAARGGSQNAKYQFLTAIANLLKAVGKDAAEATQQ